MSEAGHRWQTYDGTHGLPCNLPLSRYDGRKKR